MRSSRASTPGRGLPSRNIREAPPPVETNVILSSIPVVKIVRAFGSPRGNHSPNEVVEVIRASELVDDRFNDQEDRYQAQAHGSPSTSNGWSASITSK